MFEKFSLKNGIRVIVSPMPQVKSVTVLILVRTGSRYETAKNNGVSHFLEHMMFKGTKKRPTPMEISNIIDSVGGAYNAFTSKEYTGFYIKAPTEHLDLVLDLLSDLLKESLFAEKEITREQGVIIEEINMYEDEPQSKVGDLYHELVYGDHALGRTIAGPKEIIAKMSREEVVSYFERNYNTSSMVVSVAGGVETEAVVGHLEKYFAGVAEGKATEYEKFVDTQVKPASRVFFKKTDQAHLVVGVRAYERTHPDRYILTLLSSVLGGTASSRLFHEVREKRGLAYYVGSEAERNMDCGQLVAVAGVNLKSLSEAIKVILEQFSNMRDQPITAEELQRAKEMWKGRMVLTLEDSYNVANWFGSRELLEGKITTPDEVLTEIDKVTTSDIQRVAKDIFKTEKLNLAVVGPFKEKDKFDTLLKI